MLPFLLTRAKQQKLKWGKMKANWSSCVSGGQGSEHTLPHDLIEETKIKTNVSSLLWRLLSMEEETVWPERNVIPTYSKSFQDCLIFFSVFFLCLNNWYHFVTNFHLQDSKEPCPGGWWLVERAADRRRLWTSRVPETINYGLQRVYKTLRCFWSVRLMSYSVHIRGPQNLLARHHELMIYVIIH